MEKRFNFVEILTICKVFINECFVAAEHLNAINKIKNKQPGQHPWRITASFGRALQDEALKAWGGNLENVVVAQSALLARAEKVYKASNGEL